MPHLKLILTLVLINFKLFAADFFPSHATPSPLKNILFSGNKTGPKAFDGSDEIISKNRTYISSFKNLAKPVSFALNRKKRDENSASSDDNSFVINDYKTFLRNQFRDKFQRKEVLEFYNLLGEHPKVGPYSSAASLVTEFKSLEQQYFSLKTKIGFQPFYRSLLNRISEYAKSPKSHEKSDQYKKLYAYLYTAALSKLHRLGPNTEPDLIVDIASYMTYVKDKFKELSESRSKLNRVETIFEHNEKFKTRFQNKIKEATDFINKEITPEIGNINELLDKQMDELLEETKKRVEEAEDEREKAIETKRKLENNMVLGKIFSVLKVCTQVVGFLGPVGSAVGAVVGTGSSIAENILIDSEAGVKALGQIPAGVKADLAQINAQMKSDKEQKIRDFNRKLDIITKELNGIDKEDFIGPRNEISRIRTSLKKLESLEDYDPKEMKALNEQLESSLKQEELELKKKSKKTDDKFAKTARRMEKVTQLAQVAASAVDIYNRIKSDEKSADAADAAVKEAREKVRQLQAYEDQIYETLIPMKKQMLGDLYAVAGELEGQPLVALDVKKWRVQSKLRDTRLKLRKFTSGFAVEDFLARSIEKLEEVMTTLVNVYDRIENYEEQKQLADYLKDINSAAATDIRISEPFLSAAVAKLEMTIESNVVINEYEMAVNALKQWLFPFAEQYLGDFQLPAHLYDSSSAQLNDVIFNSQKKVYEFDSKIKNYKSAVHSKDKFIFSGEFDSRYATSKGFYTWSNEEYADQIHRLLRGKEAWLMADVERSDPDKDAIKFNLVKFRLDVRDEAKREDWNGKLKGFLINATHTGNSYYRYKEEICALNSESVSIAYTFENKRDKKEPKDKNAVYDKIKDGDITLSPYTMWKVRLVPASAEFKFADLRGFKDEVFIELVGSGSYVRNNVQNANDYDWHQYRLYR